MLGSEFFTQQTSKPNLIKLMDRLNSLPKSLKESLHEKLSGKLYTLGRLMSSNFVRLQEIINKRDAENFRFIS